MPTHEMATDGAYGSGFAQCEAEGEGLKVVPWRRPTPFGGSQWKSHLALGLSFRRQAEATALRPLSHGIVGRCPPEREDAKKPVLDGQDLSIARKRDKAHAEIAKESTFGLLAGEYIARLENARLSRLHHRQEPVAARG